MVIQYLLLVLIAAALYATVQRARQRLLSRTETLLWSAAWVAAAAVVLRPDLATAVARFLGVGRGVDAVLYLAVLALFTLVFRLFLRIDKMERDVTLLVRGDALAARTARKDGSEAAEAKK